MPAFDPRSPFTREEGLAAGLSPARLRGPAFRTILRGVYVDATVEDSPRRRRRC